MGRTRIEWCDSAWNPVTGCSKVSPGCQNCYAERHAKRLAGRFGYPKDDPFTVTVHRHSRLLDPLGWRKPKRIFLGSMTDMFHDDVPFDFIDQVLAIVALCDQHTFMVLTKRPSRMLKYFIDPDRRDEISRWWSTGGLYRASMISKGFYNQVPWPLPNLQLGVSAEDQPRALKRLPILAALPAAVRFLSYEPALGPLDLTSVTVNVPTQRLPDGTGIEWLDDVPILRVLDGVIAGPETGPGARPGHPDHFRSLCDQCTTFGVNFFFKSWGDYIPVSQVSLDQNEVFNVARKVYKNSPADAFAGKEYFGKVGKTAAGRLLDGREHNALPGMVTR